MGIGCDSPRVVGLGRGSEMKRVLGREGKIYLPCNISKGGLDLHDGPTKR
jgi:hypothetical protein